MTERRLYYRVAVRAAVWDACGGRCHYCNVELHPFRTFHLDHVVSLAAGGTDTEDNLVGACPDCNQQKNAREDREARRERKQHLAGIGVSDLGRTLNRLRREAGMSMQELSRAAGVHVQTISEIESGRSKTSQPATVHKLAGALGVQPQELLKKEMDQ